MKGVEIAVDSSITSSSEAGIETDSLITEFSRASSRRASTLSSSFWSKREMV